MFLVFSNFSETPGNEGWFSCKDFAGLINKGCFLQVGDSIYFCLPRLYLYLRGAAF